MRSFRAALLACGPIVLSQPVVAVAPAGEDVLVTTARVEPAGIVLDGDALRSVAIGSALTVAGVTLDDGRVVTLDLERFSVTDAATRFVVARGLRPIEFDATRVALLRGKVRETGGHAVVAWSKWGGCARLVVDGAVRVLRVKPSITTPPRPHLGSRWPDLPLCGTDSEVRAVPAGGPPAAAVSPRRIDLAVETDFELYDLFGDADAAMAYLVSLYGFVSDIYLRDVQTSINLSFVRIWDTPDDIINGSDPLGEFRQHWIANMGIIDRDLAQFLSGRRDFPYGGAAYLGTVCSLTAGYSAVGYVMGRFGTGLDPGVNQYDIHVAAHEIGHNCDALHTHNYALDTCDDLDGSAQRGSIMSYCSQTRSGGNANTDLRFHAVVQDAMRAHIFASGCLIDDCNGNGTDDAVEIMTGGTSDRNGNGVPDECEDCNGNGTLDPGDILAGTSFDVNGNGVPDECEPDCNGNDLPDTWDIAIGAAIDLYGNNIPDSCEADCNGNGVNDYDDIQANMSLDVDRDGVLDECQDCDGDGRSDVAELTGNLDIWLGATPTGVVASVHAVTGVVMPAVAATPVSSPHDVLITPDRRVLVTSSSANSVIEVADDGTALGELVPSGAGGLTLPAGMLLRPDNGNLLVASRGNDSIKEYDVETGVFVRTLVESGVGGLVAPFAMAWAPDDVLLVTANDDRVLAFDPVTGAALGDRVTLADNGGLRAGRGMLIIDDRLLITSFLGNEVLAYNATSGAFLGKFNDGGTDVALTLDGPWGIRLGPEGDIYVSRFGTGGIGDGGGSHEDEYEWHDAVQRLHINSTRIYIFHAETGRFMRSHTIGNDTGLVGPTGFDFMPPTGVDCNGNRVPDACDIISGRAADANGNGILDTCELTGDLDGDGLVGILDLLMLLSSWGPCPAPPDPCVGDLDGDGVVAIADLLALLSAWTA